MTEATWLCPNCGLKTFPYGQTCPDFADETCENMDKLNINGKIYLETIRSIKNKQKQESESIGISAISDE